MDEASLRRMDCMDCHNRPAHRYQTPNDAVSLAMSLGKIDRALPYIKSNARLRADAALHQRHRRRCESIATILAERYPNDPRIRPAIGAVQQIYTNNFFPEMKASWKDYPDNIGHKDWPGCFRCHDGLHKTADGKRSIKANDCNACHTILAQGSGAELDQLTPKARSSNTPATKWKEAAMIATPADCKPQTIDCNSQHRPTLAMRIAACCSCSALAPVWARLSLASASAAGQEPQQRLPRVPFGQDAHQDQRRRQGGLPLRGRGQAQGLRPQDPTPASIVTSTSPPSIPDDNVPAKAANCIGCHNPQPNHEEAAREYATSIHGVSHTMGASGAASCWDCHGSHDMLPVTNPDSPVFKLNLPGTCAKCHSNPGLTKEYQMKYPRGGRAVHGQHPRPRPAQDGPDRRALLQ